jgi:hypothetical protein
MKKIFTLTILAGLILGGSFRSNAQECNCMIPLDSTFSLVPFLYADNPGYRNDDSYTSAVMLPFTFSLYGTQHDSCFINNNGNISFGSAYSTYTASGFPIAGFPMVAAFWADVDTRDSLSGLVYYKMTDHALIIRWDAVGYFSYMSDKLNDFQLIISDGQSDLIPDGNNISFCYGDMQWTTGTASGGVDGFGGSPANIGANAGDGVFATQIGLFDSSGDAFDGANGNYDGVDYLDYAHIYFSTNPLDSNQTPVGISNYCDTIIGYPGDSLAFFFYDPEAGQDFNFNLITDWGQYLSIDQGFEGMTVVGGEIQRASLTAGDRGDGTASSVILYIAPSTPIGVYPFTIQASDNGDPIETVSLDYVLQIGQSSPNSVSIIPNKPQVNAYIQNGKLMFTGIESASVNSVQLFDATGRAIASSTKLNDINMNTLHDGVYLFVVTANGKSYSGKISK